MSQSQFYTNVFRYPFKSFGEKITLCPFADVHRDSKNCDVRSWLKWCESETEKVNKGENRLYIGVGDYMDFVSDSERWNLSTAKKHESTTETIDEMVMDMCDDFIKEIEFMRGRIIGLHEGNHHWGFQNGTTSTQYLCQKLGCRYLGGVATTKLFIDKLPDSDKETFAVDILSSHWGGGGKLMGTALNSLADMVKIASMDIYLQAHNHQRICQKTAKPMYLTPKGKLKARDMVLCNPGSYLLGYVDGRESYAVKKLMRPVSIGQAYIEMIPTKLSTKGELDRFIDFTAISH